MASTTEIEREEEGYAQEWATDENLFDALMGDSYGVECADGCIVEPDGVCPHGYHSPLITLGMI